MRLAAVLFLLFFCFDGFALNPADSEVEVGHESMRAKCEIGNHERWGPSLGFAYRFGLHDFLDRTVGHSDTQLELLNLAVQYFPEQRKFFLDELTAIRVARLPPLSAQWRELSWKVDFGMRSIRERLCTRCGAGNLLGGLGVTVAPLQSPDFTLWLLAEIEMLFSPGFTGSPIKPTFGPRGGLRWRFSPEINAMLQASWRLLVASEQTEALDLSAEIRWAFFRNWATQLRIGHTTEGWDWGMSFFAYF